MTGSRLWPTATGRGPTAIALICVALLCGCGTPGHRAAWEGDASRAETVDLVRLHQLRDAVDSAWERQQSARLRGLLSEGVVFAPPDGQEIVGRDAALEWFGRAFAGLKVWDTYVSEAMHLTDDWALETWSIDRRLRRGNESGRARLKGMHLYRRADDGRWLLAYRIWNENPAHSSQEPVRERETAPRLR